MRQHRIRKSEAHAAFVQRTCRGAQALISIYQIDTQLTCIWFS